MSIRILTAVVVSMFVCQQVHAQEDGEPEQAEVTELEGTWEVVSSVLSGDQIGSHGLFMRWEGNRSYQRKGDDEDWTDVGAFSLDPSAMPPEIDFMLTSLPDGTGFTSIPGIYELDGDSLTMCMGIIEQARPGNRPEAFESTEGSPTRLWVLRRVEEDDE